MRHVTLWATLLILLALTNYQTYRNEWIIRYGETIFLELVPVDPRSRFQGDYIRLSYQIGQGRAKEEFLATPDLEGKMVVALDGNKIATYQRLYKGEKLAPNERIIKFRLREELFFGAAAFFVPEGKGDLYNDARFGELKLGPDGTLILVGLRDGGLDPVK